MKERIAPSPQFLFRLSIFLFGLAAVCGGLAYIVHSVNCAIARFAGAFAGIGRGMGKAVVAFAEVLPKLVFVQWMISNFGWIFRCAELAQPLGYSIQTKAAPFFDVFIWW